MSDGYLNFTFVLVVGGLFCLVGFILLLLGSKWVKPWGKQYVTANRPLVLLGWLFLIMGAAFILYQAGIRQ